MEGTITILLFCTTFFSILLSSTAVDIIRANQAIRDGDTIISAGGEFELGFFSPGSSTNRYLGIWYKRISFGTVVWVANREIPITNTTGVLRIDSKEIMLLVNGSNSIIWSTKSSRVVKNPVAQLLDTGNFVFRDESDGDPENENFVWQSFDYPGDNMLPGMKFGLDLVTGLERYYTSWKSADDPSPGSFTHRLDPHGYPQLLLWKGSVLWFRDGPWIGSMFSGNPYPKRSAIYINEFVINPKEIYYEFDVVNKSSVSAISRLTLSPTGVSQRLIWNDQNQDWVVYFSLHASDCDHYALCGAYGICDINNSPRCDCLSGFEPKFPEKWEAEDWSNGCIRRTQLDCRNGDGFKKYSGMKLPDTQSSWYNMNMNLEECEKVCSKNCSCTAYANADIREGGSGCLLWFDELMDIIGYTEDGQDIYVRMPASELEESRRSKVTRRMRIILFPVVLVAVLVALFLIYGFKKINRNREGSLGFNSERVGINRNDGEDLELPLFDFKTIANATDNFCNSNMLGEGGFGPVYKGTLHNGQEIAVKRLSKNSRQGIHEFKNEVSYIAKLQHRNLVTLLGCCIEEGEKMLIYEYMLNKSLDSFIFDEEISKSLDWPKRYNIINGVARGLLYLHQDSKLRIIHRDLKTSNILLDHEMNPKISDFGLARSFGGNQTEANTTRVVGTYGYMSPEYVIDGLFSIKSDVYSFGVLVLEIVTGKKNRCFDHPDHNHNLVGHAWKSYNEDKLLEVVDRGILESYNQNEVFRVIQIGLLCVQQYSEDRPSMSAVVLMLNSKTTLIQPKQPGFFNERTHEADYSLSKPILLSSSNEFTITAVVPR